MDYLPYRQANFCIDLAQCAIFCAEGGILWQGQYSRTSLARTLMARLPRLLQTRS